MCGIAGFVGLGGDRRVMAERLRGALRHRGPDDDGVACFEDGATLVHTRLAVFDPSSAGHQPMVSDDAGTVVVLNGAIYNFRELRAELERLGRCFRTRSDTEVVLHAYRAWGPEAVERLRGMFAVVIADAAARTLTLVRDRLGIKPLYLHRPRTGGLVFASEMRALLVLGELAPREVCPASLEGFLAQGAVQGEDSLLRDVALLPPATMMTVDLSSGEERRVRRYWQLGGSGLATPSRAAAVERLRSSLRESMRLHLHSDVPLGLFLSGGIDSAALLALGAEAAPSRLRTLTIGFDEASFDESAGAGEAAARFGTRHETLRIGERELAGWLPEALTAVDQPTVDGFNTYIVARAARRAGLTVALSGLGGDELFGGYATFRDVPAARRWALLFPLLRPFRRAIGGLPLRGAAKLAEATRRGPDPVQLYLLRRELFLREERRQLQPLPPGVDPGSGMREAVLAGAREATRGLDPWNRMSYLELSLYMRSMLLRDADAFSMAIPIELRVPLLDHEVVESVLGLPGRWKRPDPRPKPLLLDAVGASLPPRSYASPKQGFAFPWGRWLRKGGPLAPYVAEAVDARGTWADLGLQGDAVASVVSRFLAGDRRISPLQVLALVVLRHFAASHRLRVR